MLDNVDKGIELKDDAFAIKLEPSFERLETESITLFDKGKLELAPSLDVNGVDWEDKAPGLELSIWSVFDVNVDNIWDFNSPVVRKTSLEMKVSFETIFELSFDWDEKLSLAIEVWSIDCNKVALGAGWETGSDIESEDDVFEPIDIGFVEDAEDVWIEAYPEKPEDASETEPESRESELRELNDSGTGLETEPWVLDLFTDFLEDSNSECKISELSEIAADELIIFDDPDWISAKLLDFSGNEACPVFESAEKSADGILDGEVDTWLADDVDKSLEAVEELNTCDDLDSDTTEPIFDPREDEEAASL